MSGNFLSCSKGVKDPLEVPEARLISLEMPQRKGPYLAWKGEPPGFSRVAAGVLDLRRVLSTYDGDLRDPLWWPQESPVPMRVARVPLRIPLPLMLGPKTLCGVGAGT